MNMELQDLRALFLGPDRFRILRPVKAGDRQSLKFAVSRVEVRDQGFAVHYDFTWHVNEEEQPVTLVKDMPLHTTPLPFAVEPLSWNLYWPNSAEDDPTNRWMREILELIVRNRWNLASTLY